MYFCIQLDRPNTRGVGVIRGIGLVPFYRRNGKVSK